MKDINANFKDDKKEKVIVVDEEIGEDTVDTKEEVDLKNDDMNECLPHSLTLSSLHLH